MQVQLFDLASSYTTACRSAEEEHRVEQDLRVQHERVAEAQAELVQLFQAYKAWLGS